MSVGRTLVGNELEDGDIDLARIHPIDQIARVIEAELDLSSRVLALEGAQHRCDLGGVDFAVAAQLDGAGQVGTVQAGDRSIVELDHLASVGQQCPAISGRTQRVTVANEERTTNAVLKPLHLSADGGLAHVEPLGGRRHAPMVQHSEQCTERFNVELHAKNGTPNRHDGLE